MSAPDVLHADVAVVGSGAGGGVIAAELAAAGVEVVLLEEGPYVRSHEFSHDENQQYDRLFRDRGLQATEDAGVVVLQGRCVGGSTVINEGDIVPVPREVVEYWREHFRLDALDAAAIDRAADRVRKRIGAGPILARELNPNNRLLLDGAAKLGYRAGVFEDNRVGCVGSGYCHLGCAYDAKQSVLITYVPDAETAGARLLANHRVEAIRTRRGQIEGLDVSVLGADREPVRQLRILAPAVFLCAGAIHTPMLLRQSRLGGRQVGRNLSLQPQAPIVARFGRRLRSFRGIPQASFVDEFETVSTDSGYGGFRIETIFGPPATATSFLPGVGKSMLQLLTRYDQMAAALVLVPDRPSGRVEPWDRSLRPRISYEPTPEYFATLRRGLLTAAEVYLAAGAEEVILPSEGAPRIRSAADLKRAAAELVLEPARVRLISAHPQGTARMSDDRQWGVVDSQFQVHRTEGLYVADASIFPTTASSHTMLPIMSMATLAAEGFLAARGGRLSDR